MSATGKLYLMPTPLDFGTLAADAAPPDLQQVLPLDVLQVAARLPVWIAENAKTARAFLKRVHGVVPLQQPLQALLIQELPRPAKGGHKPVAAVPLDPLLAAAQKGQDTGLVSEAGMPAVADPGAQVVRRAHELGIEVVPLVGPSSLLLALAASGMNGQSFAFVGYLPVEEAARGARIRELEACARRSGQTQMMIETPYRNTALMQALLTHLQPATRLSVACGLTLAGGWNRSLSVQDWKRGSRALPSDVPAVFAIHGG
ncbi:SAM-dependent methyltransferase [Schlegelella sp. S2-27]|uniref:SAM-dependent methyltransferase n=1 Tax=Caldimonas mangrovi TaxID=2944811 RepID=A0ABT0YQ43_9BURK|nr:SAM-dependent methyltransferase [Caldimonas mangrovi]MCM5680846.1 SAM-dependent methyltransferase [Caldimonas mangrovi]